MLISRASHAAAPALQENSHSLSSSDHGQKAQTVTESYLAAGESSFQTEILRFSFVLLICSCACMLP